MIIEDKIKSYVLDALENEPVKVILFGSRALGKSRKTSDFDIGIIPYGTFSRKKITQLKAALEESTIPYHIDIVNFAEVSDEFKNHAMKGAKVWKE